VVFVCENNLYATETPFHRVTRNTNVASRAAAYGIPGFRIDGNDVLEVYRVAGEAVARARAGEGPTLIECETYRPLGHFEGDPGIGYRSKEEIAAWKQRDPIDRFAAGVRGAGLFTEAELIEIDRQVEAEIEAAYEFAKASPEPDPATVTNFVYAG
jgi:2-oxoisovalerate dehydrogenase E1 component